VGIRSDVSQVAHSSENPVAPDHRTVRIGQGVECRGRFWQAGEHGHLGQGQFRDRLVVINLCSGGNSVGPIAQIDLVQIELENAVFIQFTFDLKSQKYLVELPDKGSVP